MEHVPGSVKVHEVVHEENAESYALVMDLLPGQVRRKTTMTTTTMTTATMTTATMTTTVTTMMTPMTSTIRHATRTTPWTTY